MSIRLLNSAIVYNGPLNTSWEPLRKCEMYEIRLVEGEAEIRFTQTKAPVKITPPNKKQPYKTLYINNKKQYLHRVIAQQYIHENPVLNIVDHYNNIKTDNNITNLRFVNYTMNNTNKLKCNNYIYTILKELPQNCFVVDSYNNTTFTGCYFDGEKFYYDTGAGYREIPIIGNAKNKYLYLRDDKKRYNKLSYKKIKEYFKKYYNIP